MLADRMQGSAMQYQCPQLPASPREAIDLAMRVIEGVSPQDLTIIGSSLGGYYATYLAEKLGCRAVLLNPAVTPSRDLAHHIGMMRAYHSDAPFEFKREYVDELSALAVDKITSPERYFLIAATGDEVLDWHEMTAHYPNARQRIIEGSDHGISDFAHYIDEVLAFCDAPLRFVEGRP
jgi:predicted esterase YcpF (UPF0227 family)